METPAPRFAQAIQCRQLHALTCRSNLQDSVHNPPIMRVLIADRNARLLESISLTFGHQFSIDTASTRKRCGDLLRQGEFDLAIVSEKLADGPGLPLLGQIARSSPDMLRIFAARRSRLQLLKGRLGRLGLFRTLPYPIDAQKLLSALTLARAGLEIDLPRASAPQHRATAPRARSVARQTQNAASHQRNIASQLAQPQRPQPQRPQPQRPQPQRPQPQRPAKQSALPQPTVARSATPPRLPSQSEAFQRALARREAAKGTANSQIVSRTSGRRRQLAGAGGGRTHSLAQTPPPGSLSDLVRVATAAHPTRKPQLADTVPKRTTVLLGVTMVVVFLVTTLILNLFFAAAAPSSSARATPTSVPRLEVEQPDISTPRENSMPLVRPMRSVARRAEPPPDSTRADVVAQNPQMAASNTPIADPSTFGSEAYEPIYSN
jgi:DNA-binding NarL/FixJ family response regulator